MFYKKLIINILYLSLFFFLFNLSLKAQNVDFEKLSLDELDNGDFSFKDKKTGENFCKIYIKKAKKENNIEALFRAYKVTAFYVPQSESFKYIDSTIIIAKKINKPIFLANAFLASSNIKDINYSSSIGIKDLLLAYKYSQKTDDNYLKNNILYDLALQDFYIGNYKEAKEKLLISKNYFDKNFDKKEVGKDYPMIFFYSTILLIDVNNTLGKQSENSDLFEDAYKKIKLNKNFQVYKPYYLSCEGVDAYKNKNYQLAISKLNEAINNYNDQFKHFAEIYYLGLTYWKLNKKEKAISYFLKLDKDKEKDKSQEPRFRPAYELLIQYYKEKGNTEKQLEYINKLLFLDRSYEKNYKYLFAKINKEYTSEKLIQEKKDIENSLKFHRLFIIFIIIFSFSVITFIFYRYTKIQKEYKQRFREILVEKKQNKPIEKNVFKENTQTNPAQNTLLYSKIAGLSASTIDSILNKLEIFESENQFLNPKITQKILSEELKTNPSYLSKIINVYKEKNFTQYINDLRLDYILERLKTDEDLLQIDVKEIANEAGFSSAESFSDNFQRKFKIKPSYFIKMMKENLNSNP
jgi:AraC-like DNA-binding protein